MSDENKPVPQNTTEEEEEQQQQPTQPMSTRKKILIGVSLTLTAVVVGVKLYNVLWHYNRRRKYVTRKKAQNLMNAGRYRMPMHSNFVVEDKHHSDVDGGVPGMTDLNNQLTTNFNPMERR